jgi:acyl carrier protein
MENEENMAVLDEVKAIIANQLKTPADQLTPDTPLEGLGADSLDLIEIIYTIEEKFNIDIPFNANQQTSVPFSTIGQVAAAVDQLVVAKTPS